MGGIIWARGITDRQLAKNYRAGNNCGVVASAQAQGSTLVLYADEFEGLLHTYLDLWSNGKQIASSDDRDTWSILAGHIPIQDWPLSTFAWTKRMLGGTPILPKAVLLERWAEDVIFGNEKLSRAI